MHTFSDFRIGTGGPLHRLETAAQLTSLARQIGTTLAVTWLPLVLFGALIERSTGHAEPILRDVSVHVRLLVATPVLLILDRVFVAVCRGSLKQLAAEGFVRAADDVRFVRLVRGAKRLADAAVPEVVLAALALAAGAAGLLDVVPIGGLTRGSAVTVTRSWYALLSWPLFQFLVWRSLWRWGIWARVLVGLSRFDLALIPTHPDRRGGIGFLSQSSVDYCGMFTFAMSSVLTAEWRTKFAIATLLEPLVLVFAFTGVLIAFGPLLLFSPRLERARRAGQVEFAGLASALARKLQASEGRDVESRRDADAEPLAHMTEIYRENVERLVPILIYKRDLIILTFATLLPVVPVVLSEVSREEWMTLLNLLTGGVGR